MNRPTLMPYVHIVTAGIIWGSTFSLALIATADGAHPVTLTALQVGLTAVCFVVVCASSRVPVFTLHNTPHYLLLAAVGIVIPDLLYYSAAPHLSAGILSITVSTVAVFTYLFMLALGRERFDHKRAFGIVLGMIAIVLLVLPEQGLEQSDASFWVILVVLCAVCYAGENVYIGEYIPRRVDIRELLCGSNLIAAIVMIPAVWLLDLPVSASWLTSSASMAIVAIAVSSTLAYLMFFHTIKQAGPVFAGQCAYVVTLSGVVWGIVLFGEQHTLYVWLSVITMMLGLFLVTPRRRESHAEPAHE